jgi:hypothetical protein
VDNSGSVIVDDMTQHQHFAGQKNRESPLAGLIACPARPIERGAREGRQQGGV